MEVLSQPVFIAAVIAAVIAILVAVACLRKRPRGFAGQLRLLADQVARCQSGRTRAPAASLPRQLHGLIHAAVNASDEQGAAEAIALLRSAYELGISRPDEAELLAALAVRAARAKQPVIAAAVLDVFSFLLGCLPTAEKAAAAEQLTNITAVALRGKENLLAAQAAEIVFNLLEKSDEGLGRYDRAVAAAALRFVDTAGIVALRRRDVEFFRQLVARLDAALPAHPAEGLATALIALIGVWLHRIIQNNDTGMYEVLADFVTRRGLGGYWPPPQLAALLKEWNTLAGTASLRPHSPLAPAVTGLVLRLALAAGDGKLWREAVHGAGQTARMAILRHGLADGFALVLPILENGRDLLARELMPGSFLNESPFRSQALYIVVRESLALAEFTARQDMITTVGDILVDFNNCWAKVDGVNRKSAKRFCQLLAACWMRSRSRQSKRAVISDELIMPALLTDADKQRLGYLL
jgi:hypothetical protein